MDIKYLILDTSAILSGKLINLDDVKIITTRSVLNEIKPGGRDYRNLQYLVEKGLSIFEPSKKSLKKIRNISKDTGDISRLSDTDIDILALALDLNTNSNYNIIILSDDYSIQNISSFIKINYLNINQSGITKRFKWFYKCIGCGKRFNQNIKKCPICGSSIKNYVSKTKKLRDIRYK